MLSPPLIQLIIFNSFNIFPVISFKALLGTELGEFIVPNEFRKDVFDTILGICNPDENNFLNQFYNNSSSKDIYQLDENFRYNISI